MEQTEHIDELAKALAAASAEFQPIVAAHTADIPGKDGKAGFSYKFATLQDCIAATRPALAKQGLAVVQLLDTTPEGFSALTTQLVHSSGQWMRSFFLPPVANIHEARAIGSALTYSRRYAYCAILGIAAEDDDDGAGAGRKPGARPPAAQQRQAQRQQQPRQAVAAGQPPGPAEPYRIKSGEFQGKTLKEIWDSGEKGQEFVRKCEAKGMSPAIRDQAKEVIEAAEKPAEQEPLPEEPPTEAPPAPDTRPVCFSNPIADGDERPEDMSPEEYEFCLHECWHRPQCLEAAGVPTAIPGDDGGLG